ncbi:MAG TPA: immunoglobulin domain-containing protein [Acidobacteriota bacterium]
MRAPILVFLMLFFTVGVCGQLFADDISPLSDEFNNASTLSQFQRVYQVEMWGADQLELFDINATRPGMMVMMPFTSTWYNDYRGELTFKLIQGDFVVTTDVQVSQRNGTGAPRSLFSLAGIMVRTPRQVTPQTWMPGGENYVFLSLGSANQPGTFQYEVKTTVNSVSTLEISPGTNHATIQVARIGSYLIMLRQIPGGSWTVHRRYQRTDMPATLQVGLTCYTDYQTASSFPPLIHNQTVIRTGNPDLVAAFDYIRYQRPQLPAGLVGRNLADPAAVSDAQLLSFLGANANVADMPTAPTIISQPQSQTVSVGANVTFSVTAGGTTPLSYQWRKDGANISGATNATLTLNNVQRTDAGNYTVVVSNSIGTITSTAARLNVSEQGVTTINVSSTVVTPSVKRFGINLGWADNYDSGQIMKQLVFRNPGFEGQLYRSIVRCVSGTASGFVDENPFVVWPSGFWNGASYEVIWGAAKGRAGTIAISTAPSGGKGSSYQFADSGAAPAAGDYLVLRKMQPGGATSGWSPTTSGGGTITDEANDLHPDTLGRQALRLTATGTGQLASLSAPFDTSVAGSFLQLNGNYRLTFKAKGVGGANALNVSFARLSPANTTFVNQTVSLTGSWNTYNFDFTAAENGSAVGSCQLRFSPVNQSAVLLDDVSLTQTNGDPSNTTAFRDPVVNALKSLNPGILRYWVEDLGDTLDNEIAPPFARLRAGYSSRSTNREDLLYGLHEFLELCELLGAEPWYVVPITFSTQEMANLMEYLGGPNSSPYGAKRAARGHGAPWTGSFSRIHLEFGNEAWNNADYYGGTISDPVAYGNRGSELFGAVRNSPYYNTTNFDLVLGGQASFPARNAAIDGASSNHDTLAVAPYFGGHVDNYATSEELFGPLFAEPEMLSQTGYMRQNYTTMQTSSRPVPMAVYEVNLHTTDGSISQSALDSFTPSLGAGLAVADHMLMMLRDLGVKDQIVYSLTQFANRRPDGKYVLLWSVVRDMGVTDRKRPQFLALKLANEVNAGNLVQTSHSGDNPTWNQPLVNSIQYNNAHYLRSYAFSNSRDRSLIVFNLSRTSSLLVNFAGVNAPRGSVTLKRLTSAAITDTNENAETVVVTSQTINDFSPGQSLSLPPYSMTVLQWRLSPERKRP